MLLRTHILHPLTFDPILHPFDAFSVSISTPSESRTHHLDLVPAQAPNPRHATAISLHLYLFILAQVCTGSGHNSELLKHPDVTKCRKNHTTKDLNKRLGLSLWRDYGLCSQEQTVATSFLNIYRKKY